MRIQADDPTLVGDLLNFLNRNGCIAYVTGDRDTIEAASPRWFGKREDTVLCELVERWRVDHAGRRSSPQSSETAATALAERREIRRRERDARRNSVYSPRRTPPNDLPTKLSGVLTRIFTPRALLIDRRR